MGDHPNAAKYRELMQKLDLGQMEDFVDMLDDDIEWWEIGRAEPIKGKAALMARMQEQMGKWDITGELHDVVANDEHLVALVNAEGKRDGRTLKYKTAEILHIRDGKVAQRWAFSDDTAAITEFFS
jgi:ketosteroid isomerase-like protein